VFGIPNETAIFLHSQNDQVKEWLRIYDRHRVHAHKKWICEKTPLHIYHINRMYNVCQHPKIVVAVRDGRDVVASLKKRYGSLQKGINRWIDDNLAWMVNPHRHEFHLIRYEDFVADPKKELTKICTFIGEDFHEEMLDYPKTQVQLPADLFDGRVIDNQDHNRLRHYQTNQDLYDGTKRYLKDLDDNELQALHQNQRFVAIMKKLNYM
jgi:hypothetical protein